MSTFGAEVGGGSGVDVGEGSDVSVGEGSGVDVGEGSGVPVSVGKIVWVGDGSMVFVGNCCEVLSDCPLSAVNPPINKPTARQSTHKPAITAAMIKRIFTRLLLGRDS